jgi:hypothetical protein
MPSVRGFSSRGIMLKVFQLCCEYRVNPVGVFTPEPRFSWKIETNKSNIMQSAYIVQISPAEDFSVELSDSGWVESAQSHLLVFARVPRSERRFWRVKIRDNQGEESGWSETAFFETSLYDVSGWKAVFISAEDGDSGASSEVTRAGRLWAGYRESVANGKNQPIWMTEASGYVDDWTNKNVNGYNLPGAFIYAQMLGLALKDGHASAWVHWQYSREEGNYEGITTNGAKDKKCWVCKHFYRYIRPGAKMVDVACDDSELLVIPFVALNSSNSAKKITLDGTLGSNFMMYQTTSSASINCVAIALNAAAPNTIAVPGRSVVILVNSNYEE